ncbi:MAG: ATP-binding protein [Lachnospiraceae bacterium]|nr:ATP-binding protein [Lachnospiraceae bacterium]
MYKNEWNILEKIQPMLVGEQVKNKLKRQPSYEESIRTESQAVRLMELNKINSFYLPSDMSVEIYTKLYLAMVRSMQKKESKLVIQQRNINGKNMRACANGFEPSFGGIIAGTDSFSVIGNSGIGKSSAISKAVQLMGGEDVIEMDNPYCKLIPVINVQCPFDCSVKSMLLAILQKIDVALGTSYYTMAVKSKANINTMLISTAQILLNHVAILCIDEIQNLIKHRAGIQLVSMMTELLNESGISIVFVGTPEVEPFFESVDYLARRTLGFHYDRCRYDTYFREFCAQLWEFQYVQKKQKISDDVIYWLYQHSAGTMSHILFLFQTAQEISILNGREILDMQALESAYQRMRMLHIHIQPDMNLKKVASKKKKSDTDKRVEKIIQKKEKVDNTAPITDDVIIQYPVNKGSVEEWTFLDLANKAKKKQTDIVSLLYGKISITEVSV